MPDPRADRLASIICRYSLALRPGDLLLIEAPAVAEELVYAVYAEALRCGAHPVVQVTLPDVERILLSEASEEQLKWVSPLRRHQIETVDARLAVIADVNTKSLSSVDPARQTLHRSASGELMQRFLERDAAGELRWCVTGYPAQGNAQDADMSLVEYADFVYRAALVYEDDPVAAWQETARRQEAVKDLLQSHSSMRVVGPGTDLHFEAGGRTWINDRGDKNLPGGEVFTGPVEESVEGHISFHFPALVDGREVDGVQLTFKGGKVAEVRADKGNELMQSLVETDEGARTVGEFAFGLNRQITRGTKEVLYDEKIGGTCHLALGASYPETGGRNVSALHQDLVCDLRHESAVYADGEQVFTDGVFLESALKAVAAS